MIALRSFLFNIAFYIWSTIAVLAFIPGWFWPNRRAVQLGQKTWAQGNLFLLRWLVGVTWEVRGLENLPKEACLVASKHQSAWDTFIFHVLLHDEAMVAKQELTKIPIYGQHFRKSETIAVDRDAGASALKKLVAQAQQAVEEGRQVVIFPEGTRTAPGEEVNYQIGVAALYNALKVPCVPVALNSGLCWGKRAVTKKPGHIVVEFLPPIEPGVPRKVFMTRLHDTIEQHSNQLLDEARKRV